MTHSPTIPAGPWARAGKATALVRRYPHLSRDEFAGLSSLYPRLPMLHLAMISADPELGPRLEAFQRDHGAEAGHPLRRLVRRVAPYVVLAAALVWAILN